MPINKTWYLRKRPVGDVAAGDLELVTEEMALLPDDAVHVRTIYLTAP